MNDLYITLPSSVRSVVRENTLADYVSELPYTVELWGEWEVALVDINFTKSWYNIRKDQFVGIQLNDDQAMRYIKEEPLSAGRYTEEQFITKLNSLLAAHAGERVMESLNQIIKATVERKKRISSFNDLTIDTSPIITLDPITRKTRVSVVKEGENVFLPTFGDEIWGVLGFNKTDSTTVIEKNGGRYILGSRAVDFEGGIYCMYVYSDCVKPSLIGDISAPCLRVCALPTEKKFGDNCAISFQTPCYYSISNRRFKSIRITLKDKTNKKMPFQFGETLVKLHFRKKHVY